MSTSVFLAVLGPAGAILVTHTPPYGPADVQKDGAHEPGPRRAC